MSLRNIYIIIELLLNIFIKLIIINVRMKNPFEILECSPDSTPEEITKQYKKLAMKYHPDRNSKIDENERQKCESKFKEIACAYTFLKKQNFKYDEKMYDFDSYSNFFFKNRLFKNGLDIHKIFNSLKNIDLEKIASTILLEIDNLNEIYQNNNKLLNKTDNICVNANIELFDIYNNVKKSINLSLFRKCKYCKGTGTQITSKVKTNCINCNGEKFVIENISFNFNSMFKNIAFNQASNEENGKRTGSVYINIFAKKHSKYRIIDDYNILYQLVLNSDNCLSENIITKTIEYLDLNYYTIKIILDDSVNDKVNENTENDKKSISKNNYNNYEFEINNYGLYIPSKDRGKLIIQVIDLCNIINKNIKQILFTKTNS